MVTPWSFPPHCLCVQTELPLLLLEQVVDLRSNALTALAPIVTIALELPHLELDLADNQWQCSDSSASLQNATSASWREKWDAICNTAVGE